MTYYCFNPRSHESLVSIGHEAVMKRSYYVYIMSNASRTLYIGMTNNLERRVAQHRSKEIVGFTKKYNISMLVYAEEFYDPASAIAREKQLKSWLRSRKIALIEEANPAWFDLAAEWFPAGDG